MSERKVGPVNWIIRAVILLSFLSLLLFPQQVYDHFVAHFTGSLGSYIIRGNWLLVIANILVFLTFLIPLGFRRKVNWKEYGLVAAFFVSLFIEMYGIPFIILFASRTIEPAGGAVELNHAVTFQFLGMDFAMTLPMVYGLVIMTIGTVLIIWGWISLYRNIDKEGLVTSGVYSISRHPQYLGFIMVIGGWLLGWPTILTVVFAPILIFMYIRVCRKEEKEMGQDHDYRSYMNRTPFLV